MNITIIYLNEYETSQIFGGLDVITGSCRMKLKPKKSCSLTPANQYISMVSHEPVKGLVRWYDSSLKNSKRGCETENLLLKAFYQTIYGLQGKFKVCCLQFMLISNLLWPLLFFKFCSTTLEAKETKINKITRRRLGILLSFTDVAIYCT